MGTGSAIELLRGQSDSGDYEAARLTGWVSTADAAARLDITTRTMTRYASEAGAVRGSSLCFREPAIEAVGQVLRGRAQERARDDADWVALRAAAELIGCHPATVLRYVQRGDIDRRDVPHNRPSLSRASVARFAQAWKASGSAP